MSATVVAAESRTRPARLAAWSLAAVGGAAAVVLAGQVAVDGSLDLAVAALLPLAFLVAGGVALRARPDHLCALLLTAVGTAHLGAYALVLPVVRGTVGDTGAWALNLVGSVVFSLGFAALAVLLAAYPDGAQGSAAGHLFDRIAVGVALLVPLLESVTRPRMSLVIGGDGATVATPEALHLVDLPFSLWAAVPLLVVAGAVLLVRRGRRAEGLERRQLSWAVGAAGLLALLLLASPAASVLVPEAVWAAVFVGVASAIPFVLLAGLARYRLMDVDVYVGRTLAHGGVLVLVVSLFAGTVALVGYDGPAAVVVVVLAALTGAPLRTRLESWVDRWLTGGRIGRQALVRHFVESLESVAPGQVAQRTVDTITAGLEVSWARMTVHGGAVHAGAVHGGSTVVAGTPAGPAACVVPLAGATDDPIGTLECGPRHGGWSEAELLQLRVLARHAALAVHGESLATELAAQVEALRTSRRRLVHAEQSVRRRLERDLHDGVQQQLVALLARLGALELVVEADERAAPILRAAREQAAASLAELRELIRGIHPPLLADRGLTAALQARADMLPLPVRVDADDADARYAPEVESAAYYVVSEGLTNVLKHARASRASVQLRQEPGRLLVTVEDDGVGLAGSRTSDGGGAGPVAAWGGSDDGVSGGSGLAGLRDRVEALGGTLTVESAGAGTTLRVGLPAETAS